MTQTLKEIDQKILETENELKSLRSKRRLLQMEKSRKSSTSYQKRKARLEETGEWLEKILKIGDIVKVTGSRSSPWRRVIAVNPPNFIGNPIIKRRRRDTEEYIDVSKAITTGINKITHMMYNDVAEKTEDLMENN